MFYNNFWTIRNGKVIGYQTKRTVTHCMIIIPNIKNYKINNENVHFVIGDGDSPSLIYCHLWDLFLKEINGFMLNVTDQYCISPATGKGGFSCHPGDLSRKCHLCHGSCKSRKRGTRPPTDSYLKACFPFLLVRWSFAFACLSRLQHSRSRLVASLADNWLICQLSVMHDVKPCTVWWYVCQDFSQTIHNKTNISLGFCDIRN